VEEIPPIRESKKQHVPKKPVSSAHFHVIESLVLFSKNTEIFVCIFTKKKFLCSLYNQYLSALCIRTQCKNLFNIRPTAPIHFQTTRYLSTVLNGDVKRSPRPLPAVKAGAGQCETGRSRSGTSDRISDASPEQLLVNSGH